MTDNPTVVGAFVLWKARKAGWKDDGEGAYEFIVRKAYELGVSDSQPACGHTDIQPSKPEVGKS